MDKSSSAWHMLSYGLKWGALIAVGNALLLPALYELYLWLITTSSGNTYLGPVGRGTPEIWILFFGFGFFYSLLPSVAGGCVLSLGIRFLVSKDHELARPGPWIGIFTGTAVSICYVALFFASDWSFSIREDWLLAVFIVVWQVIMYSWLGRRLTNKIVNLECLE